MLLKQWDDLPDYMRNEKVRIYYDILKKKKVSIVTKRIFDIVASLLLIIILSPILIAAAIAVRMDTPGGIFFMQERVTQYGRIFKMFKFRSMVKDAPNIGPSVTIEGDSRITKTGRFLRKFRIDEMPQLFNILIGDLTFVGTRPEVKKYVAEYTYEMTATLLLPAGVTSMASVAFRNEDMFLQNGQNADIIYVKRLMPAKMSLNLEYLRKFSFFNDIQIIFMTVVTVFLKNNSKV